MSNFTNRIQQGCQETADTQSQDSQDGRLDRGALRTESSRQNADIKNIL